MLSKRSILILLFGLLTSLSSFAVNFDSTNAPLQAFQDAGDNSNTPKFVPVDQAFPFNFYQQGATVHIDWQIKKGYYLYQERLSFQAKDAQLGDVNITKGTFHHDEFFGDVHIYTEPLSVDIPLSSVTKGGELIVQYQGCATSGFCYPPETRIVPLDTINTNSTATSTNSTIRQTQHTTDNQNINSSAKDASIANQLAQHWWTPLLFLALGIGLAFTPCVFPMYPILTGIVLGGGRLSATKAFKLSFVYVQGMAITYMLLGLVVASLGVKFQAALQSPTVLIILSILFVLLSLSMFGLYTIQLPSRLQTWLNTQSNKQQGGNLIGVFLMGVISGLVCSPCTTAPLSGALLYVAQSGDLITGAIALYALAIGMGIPLIIVAVFGNKLLPQAGEWMNRVKIFFGFILLAAPIFLLERIIPVTWANGLWVALGLTTFSWLFHVKQNMKLGSWQQSLVGIIAILGLIFSSYFGLQFFGSSSGTQYSQPHASVQFTRIKTVADLEQQLMLAKQAGKPVMFDYYADWCVACKEFEKYTFHDPKISQQLSHFILLQADVTAADPDDVALMKQMKVLGLPTIEFWDANGNHVPNARITGFIKAAPFFNHLFNNKLVTSTN